jgi:hypothetical protein
VITCNIIGTDVGGGLAKPNGTIPGIIYAGITIKNIRVQETYTTALNNIVDANLVSGNIVEGVQIIGPVQPGDVGFNQVLNNFIGTDLSGMQPIPNHREGVNLTEGTHDNQVFGNLISANLWDGIGIQGFSNIGFLQGPIFTSRNIIRDNRIGIDNTPSPNPPGALGNGNHGIAIGIYGPNGLWGYADSNQVVNNTSWFNSAAGIALWEDKASADPPDFAFPFANTDMNYLSQNSIWSNGGLGIDIEIDGVTLNDGPADPDMAANQQLNFPYSMTVAIGGTSEMVSGIVDPGAINVEVYLTNPDPSGYGEGKTYLGSATPNAAGQWSLTTFGKINTASFVTAIAHDGLGNTSEFGQNVSPPLAIDLLSFSVAAKKKSIQLNWQVPLNLHVAKFCVQRALIDEPFKEIEVLPGNEFTRKYTFTFEDFNVRGGVDYMYRIGLERMDGTFYYTSIEMARIDNLIKHVFPNPTRQNIVNVNIGNCVSGELQLISSTGGVLRTVILNEQEEIQLDIKSLIPGIYSIRFINNQSLWAERLVVL